MLLIVTLGQLLCSSNGASRKTGGVEEEKEDGYHKESMFLTM